MNATDQVKLLSGTREQQSQLYSDLLSRINSQDNPLQDYEISFLEALKKIFTGDMSATAYGHGGM